MKMNDFLLGLTDISTVTKTLLQIHPDALML